MGEYTPEPWRYEEFLAASETDDEWWAHIWGADGASAVCTVNWTYNDDGDPEANARRIVACVNALAGVPTETLEQECTVAASLKARADASEAALERAVGLLRGLVDHAIPTMEIELDAAGEEEIEAWQAARAFLDKQGEG